MAQMNMAATNVPGLLSPGNIDLAKRPVVKNADGTISTVRSMSFNEDGREILVPTVSPDGRILDNNQAIDLYHQTGQNLGVFDSPDAATQYAQTLHNQQDAMYSAPKEKKQVIVNIQGKKVKVDDSFLSLSPEQQADTVDEIAKSIGVAPKTAKSADMPNDQPGETTKDLSDFMHNALNGGEDDNAGPLRTVDSFMRGAADTASFGFGDEISGILQAANPFKTDERGMAQISNPIQSTYDYFTKDDSDASHAIRRERALQAQRDEQDPIASTTGRVAGALTGAVGLMKAGAPFMAALPAEAGLGVRIGQGAMSGGLYSGLYGIGSGEGLEDRAVKGATSAATGAIIGGAIPGVTAAIGAATKPVRDAIKGYIRPEAFANQKIAERLAYAGTDADQAAAKMARSPGLSLADVAGKPTQNLLKTTTNIPGKAQARVATQLAQKAMQQGDRIRSAIKTMFADPDGYIVAKDKIAADAKTAAAPLFAQAKTIAIPYTQTLEDALATPAGKQALHHAEILAGNEQVPFQQLFINMTSPTTGTVKRVPDVRAWEYIRQSLDDMIKAQKDPITKEITNEGRILIGLQNRIFSEVRAANPFYDAGLKIFRGAHTLEDAMKAGKEALSQSPQANQKIISAMSTAEKEAYKIGVANALRDKVGRAGFTQNALLKFFSNRDELANLKVAFDDPAQFAAFRKQMFSEARKRSTYNVVTGNSSTAKQLADMADAGGLNDTVNFAKDAVTAGPVTATLKWVGSRMKMLGGFTPEVADRVARKLMTTNPGQAQLITQELARIERAAISADAKRQLVYKLITPAIVEPATAAQQR